MIDWIVDMMFEGVGWHLEQKVCVVHMILAIQVKFPYCSRFEVW